MRWKDVPKFRVGAHRDAEQRTVRGLAVLAARGGHDVLAFARDADRMVERVASVDAAIGEVEGIAVAGGVAVRSLDSWCLALAGRPRSESVRQPKVELEAAGCRTTEDRVAVVAAADLAALPGDAGSLRVWLGRAQVALGSSAAG